MSVQDIGTCEWDDIFPQPKPRRPGWVIVDPDGRIEGIRSSVSGIASADEAHRKFTPRKRDRDRELREGWTVRAEQPGDAEAFDASFQEVTE